MRNAITLSETSPEVLALAASDARLGTFMGYIGSYSLALRTDYFPSLVRAITGQQLSVKAADAIFQRIQGICNGAINPETLISLDEDLLRSAGLSKSKAIYVKDLSHKVISREVDLGAIPARTDHEIVENLTGVKGIGKWTAEIFLIFSLGRPDVFALDDLGLKSAVKWLYKMGRTPTREEMREYSGGWKPYRTAASLYLWEIINRGLYKQDVASILPE